MILIYMGDFSAMTMSILDLLGRALLMLASFTGLCAFVRTQLKVNRFIAPFAVCCSAIVLLMLGGMLRVLEPVFWLIYIAGFAGLIFVYGVRRQRPEYGLIAAMGLFVLFLVWRFYFCKFYANDDISHWSLVTRHLLKYDAFPDKNTSYVFFQSYPLGAPVFIYYICKTIGSSEGLYMVAYNFLLGAMFLPVFSLISPKNRRCRIVAVACFVFLFHYFRNMTSLQVDILLPFMGIGTIAAIAHHRHDFRRALALALPGVIAVVYVKNSGMFFALMGVICLLWTARRSGVPMRRQWKAGLLCTAGFIGAYLLWTLHIRLSYPAALETKHAVSLTAYAAEIAIKGGATALQVIQVLLGELLGFSMNQLLALAFALGCAGVAAFTCLTQPDQRAQLPRLLRAFALCAGVYGVWFVLLCGMYLFSMPTEEALGAASFWRYNGSGLTYMMGLIAIVFFVFWGSEANARAKLSRPLSAAAALFLVVLAAVYPFPQAQKALFALDRPTEYSDMRRGLIAAREEYQLDNDDHFLIVCSPTTEGFGIYANYYYQVKYEFETTNIHMIAEKDGQFLAGTWEEKDYCADITPFLEDVIDQCDAVLVMDKSEAFETQLNAFLETYQGDTPVIYAYQY